MTYSIAPPAKPSITGRNISEAEPSPKPAQTPIISSSPIATDMRNVRRRVTPASSRGAMMTIPSGTFCRAMPADTIHAGLSPEAPLMLTPAAIPSGSLCIAMAITKSSILFRLLLLWCSSGSSPVMWCRCGVTRSRTFRKSAPAITPTTTTHQPEAPPLSRAGSISPRVEAASMTPAQ